MDWRNKYRIDEMTGCWVFGTDRATHFNYRTHRGMAAHRFVYQELVGPIPAGHVLDHLCNNVVCVNPAHLEAITHQENTKRGKHGRSTEELQLLPVRLQLETKSVLSAAPMSVLQESEVESETQELTCKRCGHAWMPRKPERPRICPNPRCHSALWEKPKQS